MSTRPEPSSGCASDRAREVDFSTDIVRVSLKLTRVALAGAHQSSGEITYPELG